MAKQVGVPHAVALSSGTAALHLALVAWGIGPGDVVVTTTLTFAATVNAILYTGAEPYFVDCDAATGNIDPLMLDSALDKLQRTGRRVPAVVVVDLMGKCADYAQIQAVADRHKVRILSDAAESVGASRDGIAAGAAGDAAVFSFNGNKIMTTSGGGMLLSSDREMTERVRYLATQAKQPCWHYEHTEVGYNYRLSNLLAALGRAQLIRLPEMMRRRRDIRQRYAALFAPCSGVELLGGTDDKDDNCWLTSVTIRSETCGWNNRDLSDALEEHNIETRPIWKPMHSQPAFRRYGALLNGCSEQLFASSLILPSGSQMTDGDLSRVVDAISTFVRHRGHAT